MSDIKNSAEAKPLRFALIGYGKMGKAIEEAALERGHIIALKISSTNLHELTKDNLTSCDVAIEFTNPHSALKNIRFCFDAGIPVICGSTGWTEKLPEIETYCNKKNGALIYASNFSIGVNLFFELNKKLASLMKARKGYQVSIEETHHTQKKDAPSGTAISLANDIINELPGKTTWSNKNSDKDEILTITSNRIDPAPGTHLVKYSSDIDTIEIIHTAHNRKGFAGGVVMAAEFIAGKKGIYDMKDVLGI